ncbi:MAG: 50S ribosomal protein L24 [Candidatus Omnitrophica bacterium]|nr:50S ribosomal protein L24 [Candidatus Omnitrophota bacterium]
MFKIKKGDTVLVLSGKDKGKKGKVLKVFSKEKRAIVERINMVKKAMRPRSTEQRGGIVSIEAPLYISKLMLICSSCGHPTRVGFKFLEDKTKVRICKKCNAII